MKLRDRYARCKKALASTNKSGTSSKAVKNAREKLKNFAFLAWLDDFIKPRRSKSNIDEPNKKKETEKPLPNASVSSSEDEEVDEDDSQLSTTMAKTAGDEDLSGDDSSISDVEGKQDHSTMSQKHDGSDDDDAERGNLMDAGKIEVTPANKTKKAPTNKGNEKKTRKKKNKMTTVEREEMAVLRNISNAIPADNKNAQQEKAKDDFDLFGEYVATKMRKLSHKLEEDDMEMIEYEITTTLMKKFKKQSNRNNVNTTPQGQMSWPNYNLNNVESANTLFFVEFCCL